MRTRQIGWFFSDGPTSAGVIRRASPVTNMKVDIRIAPDNNVVDFEVTLNHGRVESVVKFSESPPAQAETNDEVVKWVERNVDQLVQNALVKLLTTAVGFFS